MITISPQVYKYLIDPFERAGSTFLQQLSIMLLAVGGSDLLVTQHWLAAADAAGFAAIIALLTSYVGLIGGLNFADPAVDLFRRVVLTFVQSFAGALVASAVDPSVVDAHWKGAAAVALIAALTAALKAASGANKPHTIGCSWAPAPADRTALTGAAA